MNIHYHVPSVSRWLLSMGSLLLAVGHASSADLSKFRRIEPQFIAALGDPAATSGKTRNHGASGTRTRARALASWTTTPN